MSQASIQPRQPVVPTWVSELELGQPLPAMEVPASPSKPYGNTRLLVRLDRQPVGYVTFAAGTGSVIQPSEISKVVWDQIGGAIAAAMTKRGLAAPEELPVTGLELPPSEPLTDPPFISVVLCTRNRPEGAAVAVADVCALEYPNFEIIVVDNASKDDATEKVIKDRFAADARVRYVKEPRPGLSFARNCALRAAKGTIIAYTDDDVRVDRWWLQSVAAGFRRSPNVGCVTGLVPSEQLDNEVQHYFDQRYTWGGNLEPKVWDLDANRQDDPLYPYSPGIFGTGANFAFDVDAIRRAGGFDEALGAGAPSGGGEDLDAFLKILRSGRSIAQEPAAVIWHVHRSDLEELNRQLFFYGAGLTAFLARYLFDPRTSFQVLRRLLPGFIKLRRIARSSSGGEILPKSVWGIEQLGMLYGPVAYARGKVRAHKIRRRFKDVGPS